MQRLIQSALAILLALCALAGCGSAPAATTQRQTVDGLTVALEQPREAVLLKNYDLTITLTDSAGAPVEGAKVSLDMAMPSMPMGQNQPIADPLGGGRYRAQALFNMIGDWTVRVHVSAGGRSYVAIFDQLVKEAGP
jgi:nitrogen fixation protein FixH